MSRNLLCSVLFLAMAVAGKYDVCAQRVLSYTYDGAGNRTGVKFNPKYWEIFGIK